MQSHANVTRVLFLIVAANCTYGQVITSSVIGTISDPSGSSIPGVQVTLTNTDTGINSQAVTDLSGGYSFVNLLAARYSVQAKKEGFDAIQVDGIQVLAGQTVRQDVTLKVGGVQQTVTVSGAAPLIKTDSQSLGGSLVTRQLADLPTSGRTINSLMALAPGVLSSGSGPSIGGSLYWGGTNFTLNGVSVNDSGNGGGAYAYSGGDIGFGNYPSVDSLQEFKVDGGNMNAEYSRMAAVSMVMKQGTNAFHGYASEQMQNTSLNANTFILNATRQPRQPTHTNQFGADIGGPIIKNKLFFYGSYSGARKLFSSTTNLNMPTVAEKNGDFSALCAGGFTSLGTCISGTQLYNPLTGEPFANNRIPTSMFAPQSKTLLSYLPNPTDPTSLGLPGGKANYIVPVANKRFQNRMDYRMDYQATSADLFYGVVHWSRGNPWFIANGNPPNYGNQQDFGYTDWAVSLTETHVFGPTAVNDFRVAWAVHSSQRTGQNTDFNPATLFPQIPVVDNGGLPTMNFSGYYASISDYGKGYPFPEYDIQFSENITKVKGRHTFKFGIDETGFKTVVNQGGPSLSTALGSYLGSFTFAGSWTGNKGWPGQPTSQGNSFADFLLGYASSDNYAGPLTAEQQQGRDWEVYAQDTFQASPRLTLYFGLRYMYQTPWRVRDNRVSYLDLKNNKLALPQDSDTVTTPPYAIASLMTVYPYETTKQAGWPLSYFTTDKDNFEPRVGFAYRPFAGNRTVIRGGWGLYYSYIPGFVGQWENIFNPPWRTGASFSSRLPGKPTAPYLPDLTFANPFPSNYQAGPTANPLVYMTEQNIQNTRAQQYNLTFEQQLSNNWATRATYVGTQIRHGIWYAGDINKPSTQQPNVPLQTQRPYQPWSNIQDTHTGGSGHMNQLQLELTKRYSLGLLLQAEYYFTQSLDNIPITGGPQNPGNYRADFGNSDSLPRHNFITNYVYDLPFGHGRKFDITNKVLDGIAGGWTVSGITTYATGGPFSVAFAVPSSIIGWQGGRASVVAGSNYYAGQNRDSHDIVSGVPWFNPAAFIAPAPWQWGNSARNTLFGPGLWNYDFGVRKSFMLREAVPLQFRADFLNAFNHMNLSNPSATIADLADGGSPQPLAGKITSGSGSRIIQLGLKLSF